MLFIYYWLQSWKGPRFSLEIAKDSSKRVSVILNIAQNILRKRDAHSRTLTKFWLLLFFFKGVHSTVAYRELIGKIELFNQYFWYAMCITFAIVALAPLPYTLARFFIYDMEEDSFYLFAPSWFVLTFSYSINWIRML